MNIIAMMGHYLAGQSSCNFMPIQQKGGRELPMLQYQPLLSVYYYKFLLGYINFMQPQLVTSSNTMDKKTLLKASAIIGGDLSSQSTGSFKGFYSSDQPLSPPILVSPMQPGGRQLRSHLSQPEDDDPENKRGYDIITQSVSHTQYHLLTILL